MVDQPSSPGRRERKTGTLSLPDLAPGMNRGKLNNAAIDDRGSKQRTKAEDEKILERMHKRFSWVVSNDDENRAAMIDDRKFLAGDQWPADVQQQRNTEKRPCLTINRLPTFVHQVTNAARENRPSINISPVGDRSNKDGAKVFKGWIRAIERHSHADIAYDTSLSDAVSSGIGYIRLTTEWAKEDSFEQVPMIKRVRNPFTVYLDPMRQEPDASDARFGFVTEKMARDEFEREYPEAQPMPFSLTGQGEKFQAWVYPEEIRVAEYYEITQEPRELVSLSTGYVGWEDDLDDLVRQKMKNGTIEVLDRRTSTDRKVMWYKVTAIEILEREEWPGAWVPIIPVLGDELDIEGKVKLSGVVRGAKDAQRMYNYWATTETEIVALAPKAPWLIAEGQDEGWENEWKTANTRSRPALHYKPTTLEGHPVPAPSRPSPVPIPEGVVTAKQGAAQDMMATTGIRFDASLQERMSDESGRAIRELQRKGDIGAFHFYDNLRRSMEFLGKQLVDLLPKLVTKEQTVTILAEDDTEQHVKIVPNLGKAYQEQQGKDGLVRFFNPKFGEYGVTVDIGPSYATKRIEASESMMEFVKANPQSAQFVMDLIADEMDWPGAEKIAARLAKTIPPQLLAPDMKDIPPQVQAMLQALQSQLQQQGQALQGAMKQLQDKQADREIALQKIESDFEAKLLGILAKTEETTRKVAVEEFRATADVILERMRLGQSAKQPKEKPSNG